MGEINKQDELKHWGVLGMRWGVRRSKKQLAKGADEKKEEKKEEKFLTTKKKSISKMTDEEVAKEANRRRLENDLNKQLADEAKNKYDRLNYEAMYAAKIKELNPPKQSFLQKMWNDIWPKAKDATLNAGKKLLEDGLVDKGKELLNIDQGDPVDKAWKKEDHDYSTALRSKYDTYIKIRDKARAETDPVKKAALDAEATTYITDLDEYKKFYDSGKRPKK